MSDAKNNNIPPPWHEHIRRTEGPIAADEVTPPELKKQPSPKVKKQPSPKVKKPESGAAREVETRDIPQR